MDTIEDTINQLRRLHRRRRFAMKTAMKVTRSTEAYIRRNATDWHPDMNEQERARIKREVQAIIKAARAGEGHEFHRAVNIGDAACAPSLALRAEDERSMEKLAMQLPVYPWIESVPGAGALGLATIVAEAGDLSNYPNVAKLWKRLGYAPYDGHAGSTWKRKTWRPRALTKQEWIDNPFSSERYALMHQIASWLWVKNWVGKAKTGTGAGAPNGKYGEIYAAHRAKTTVTHPDWSDGHQHSDALRIVMKEFLKDLWVEWRKAADQQSESERQLVAAE
jgi:Transposase IS116/IS110/IS902 family